MNKQNYFIVVLLIALLSGCSTRGPKVYSHYRSQQSYSHDSSRYNDKTSKKTYSHPTMKPYVVRGIKYYPTVVNVGDEFSGVASWYGPDFHGKLTSNGETYNMYAMTAAHKTLPMNTIVKVTNESNGLSTIVRINDRGPFVATRIIDLSNAAAHKINMVGKGTAPVTIEVLGFESKGAKKISSIKHLRTKPQGTQEAAYALQIGSFSSFEGALQTQEQYDKLDGYSTMIKDVDTGGLRMFKVWLSGFKSEKEARDYKSTSIFQNSFIVRDN